MNILHINKYHYLRGGSEAIYFGTAKLLEAHGHSSVFFSIDHPENVPCESSKYFMTFIDLNTNDGSIIGHLRAAGRILYSLEARKCLSKLLDRCAVDLAHIHNIYHQISPSVLHELKKRNIPVVMTMHDYKIACASYLMVADSKPCESCSGGKYISALIKKCVKESRAKSIVATIEMYLHHKLLDIYDNVDVFIAPSKFMKNKLIEMGCSKNIVQLCNFIDANKYGINSERNCGENSVVYFGRLSREKGLWTLLKAAKILNGIGSIKIKIIGEGPLRDELEHFIKTENVHNVTFYGYLRGESLLKEIQNSKGVIIPSECYENNPMSCIEAFALGKPAVGARIGGIPELIKDGETGFTFEPCNAEDLAEKTMMLLNNEYLRIEMGINARRIVDNELNPEKHYQHLMEIYEVATELNDRGKKHTVGKTLKKVMKKSCFAVRVL